MINFDNAMEKNMTHNLNWLYIAERPYRILIIRGAELGKANAILNLIYHQEKDDDDDDDDDDVADKIYLYAKYPYESKHQFSIKKRKSVGFEHFNDPKAITEYSDDMDDTCKNL